MSPNARCSATTACAAGSPMWRVGVLSSLVNVDDGLSVLKSRHLVAGLGVLVVRERTHDKRISLRVAHTLPLKVPTTAR